MALVGVATTTSGARPHLPLPTTSRLATMKITISGWSTSAVSRNVCPVAVLRAVLTGCPVVRFGLLPERFGMQLPGVLRSLPSRLPKVTAPQALQRLGRLLVQFLGAAVCCKLTRLR
jgi:hypothetical protein